MWKVCLEETHGNSPTAALQKQNEERTFKKKNISTIFLKLEVLGEDGIHFDFQAHLFFFQWVA